MSLAGFLVTFAAGLALGAVASLAAGYVVGRATAADEITALRREVEGLEDAVTFFAEREAGR